MPSQAHREARGIMGRRSQRDAIVVTCAKGIERETGELLTTVLEEELPDHAVAVLSGPGFAADIASGLPTAMTIAAADIETAALLAETLSGRTFRLYASMTVSVCSWGGAEERAGHCLRHHRGFGAGGFGAGGLISRGLAEMSRLVAALEARQRR